MALLRSTHCQEFFDWIQNLNEIRETTKTLSVEDQNKIFVEKTGIDEESLKQILSNTAAFYLRFAFAPSDEEKESIEKEFLFFVEQTLKFRSALEKYQIEEKQNSIPPAA